MKKNFNKYFIISTIIFFIFIIFLVIDIILLVPIIKIFNQQDVSDDYNIASFLYGIIGVIFFTILVLGSLFLMTIFIKLGIKQNKKLEI